MLKCVISFLRRASLFYARWQGRFAMLRLRFDVVMNDGTLDLSPFASAQHPVRFSGMGHLIVKDNVVLGFSMAGAKSSPIILQPREREAVISIGRGTYVVNGCEFYARTSITIGENCLIGPRTTIMDSDFHGINPLRRGMPGRSGPVVLQDNVWLGCDVTVLKNVVIGKDSVVGAHCVVTKSVPPGAIVIGNPMKIVGSVYERE